MRQYLLCACALMAACASGATVQRPVHVGLLEHDRRHLVLGEVDQTEAGSAYDLIHRLRPEFLSSRGPISILFNISGPEVYIDGMRRGGIDELRALSASDVYDVSFYPMSAVPVSLGGSHPAGVIAVRTRAR